MYFIVEIQGFSNGSFTHLVTTAATRNQAESEYHRVLSAAAVSELPMHSAILFTGDGTPLLHQCYTHSTPDEEATN